MLCVYVRIVCAHTYINVCVCVHMHIRRYNFQTYFLLPSISQTRQERKRLYRVPIKGPGHALVTAVFFLGCFGGCCTPPIVQIYPPISVSETAAPLIRMSWPAKSICIQELLPNSYTHTSTRQSIAR